MLIITKGGEGAPRICRAKGGRTQHCSNHGAPQRLALHDHSLPECRRLEHLPKGPSQPVSLAEFSLAADGDRTIRCRGTRRNATNPGRNRRSSPVSVPTHGRSSIYVVIHPSAYVGRSTCPHSFPGPITAIAPSFAQTTSGIRPRLHSKKLQGLLS